MTSTQREYAVLTLIIATIVSIVIGLALFWAGVVAIACGGLSLFALVLHTGWSQAQVESLGPLTVANACGLWLWLGLVVYFGLESVPHWPWFVFLLIVVVAMALSVRAKI